MGFFAEYGAKLAQWWHDKSALDVAWFAIGMAGQSLFFVRWFIQSIASERAGRLVVPNLFWYVSLAGGLMVLAYGVYEVEPVIVLGQFGVLIYARNIYFLWRDAVAKRALAAAGVGAVSPAE